MSDARSAQPRGAQSRGSAHRRERREAFLDAADRAIRTAGADVSMADVAAQAGVTKPVLYRYVADKDDLTAGLAERYAAALMAVLADSLAPSADPRLTVRTTIEAYLEFIESEPEMYRFLVHGGQHAAGSTLHRFTHQLAARVTTLLTDELARFGRDTAGAEAFAHGLIGMVQSTGEWWLARRTLSRTQLARQLTRVLWTGLAGLPEAEPSSAGH